MKEGKSLSLLYYVAAEDSSVDMRVQSKSGGKKKVKLKKDHFLENKYYHFILFLKFISY